MLPLLKKGKKRLVSGYNISFSLSFAMVDPDIQIRGGGGGHPDPEIRGMPGLQTKICLNLKCRLILRLRQPKLEAPINGESIKFEGGMSWVPPENSVSIVNVWSCIWYFTFQMKTDFLLYYWL